jgi:alpha/beta hydrolase family protein
MAGRWLGLDPGRLDALARGVAAAAVELRRLTCDEPAAAQALAAVHTVAGSLETDWLPALRRIAADTSLIAWSSAAGGAGTTIVPQPPGGDARTVATWWDALSSSQRLAVIYITPGAIGNRDGVPAWARDRANRQLLEDDLQRLAAAESVRTLDDREAALLVNARAARSALDAGAGFDDPRTGRRAGVQLYAYEPGAFAGDGRVAIAVGDLDTAEHIAIAVPGMGTEASRLGLGVPRSLFTAAAARTGQRVAVLTWIGYDAPSITVADGDDRNPFDDAGDWIGEAGDLAAVVTAGRATRGATRLAADVSGIRARRGRDVHLTVLGNSYGSTTVAIAADEFGLAADDVILTGSPGAGRASTAEDLTTGTAHTWVGSASDDPVSYLGRTGGTELHDAVELVAGGFGVDVGVGLGQDPTEDDFGARRFRAEWAGRDGDPPWSIAGHDHYFDSCGEALRNIGAIVAGRYDAIAVAGQRHKDESWDPWDPFADLVPSDPEADRVVGTSCER